MVRVRQHEREQDADRGGRELQRPQSRGRVCRRRDPLRRPPENGDGLFARQHGCGYRSHMVTFRRATVVVAVCLPLAAQTVYTYIGQITATSVLIAWGTAQ